MNTLIDTDALLGLFNIGDPHHKTATFLAKRLVKKGINTLLLPTTLGEFALVASYKIGRTETQKAVAYLTKSHIPIIEVDEGLVNSAVAIYKKQTSKESSLFDCYIMAAAKKLGIKYIFSFDEGYTQKINKFRLVSDME